MRIQNDWAICLFKPNYLKINRLHKYKEGIDISVTYIIFKLASEIFSYDSCCVFIVFKYNADNIAQKTNDHHIIGKVFRTNVLKWENIEFHTDKQRESTDFKGKLFIQCNTHG